VAESNITNDGLKINVDIDQLIQTIYIHRNQKTGIKLVIQLVKQLGFDFTIEKSDLESDILI
jgi:hypothetical protein